MNTVPNINWVTTFKNGDIPHGGGEEATILGAIDTEYQGNYTSNENLCLCYTYAFYFVKENIYIKGIIYVDYKNQERLSLQELLFKIFSQNDLSLEILKDHALILIAHYFTAEWAMLTDRQELVKRLEFIRKTLITNAWVTVKYQEIEFYLQMKDTMLLVPANYKSLEKASTLLDDYEKIHLEDEDKSNMLRLLNEDKDKFEAYAIRDADITLKLFIKLQYMLNVINKTDDYLFSTLASASTRDFKNYSKGKFPDIKIDKTSLGTQLFKMQFDRRHTIYKKYESLANRAYMGGLNSSYHVGYSGKEYTYVDIDFKNAYPTAMNLLKVGNFGTPVKRVKPVKEVVTW